jgi:chloramphenicol 3-O phosphotransferase
MNYGRVIILNGASSSGKTSILNKLQGLFEDPYLNVGIDKFIWMLPKRYLDRPLWDDVLGMATKAGAMGNRLFSSMHKVIQLLSLEGVNVIADHVLVEPEWVEECARLFAPLPAYLVGVQCPLEVLIQREAARKDRTLGQAAAQFPLVHKDLIYDLVVDTSLLSVEDCALQIKETIDRAEPPHAFSQLINAMSQYKKS